MCRKFDLASAFLGLYVLDFMFHNTATTINVMLIITKNKKAVIITGTSNMLRSVFGDGAVEPVKKSNVVKVMIMRSIIQ